MGRALAELRDEVMENVGAAVMELVEPADIDRWVNVGRSKLGYAMPLAEAVTWTAGDNSVAFPADYGRFDGLLPDAGVVLPAYRLWGATARFLDPDGADSDGTATLFYYAEYPAITEDADSEMTFEGEEAAIAYATYRVFKRLASGRAEYSRYATLTGANGVGVDELAALADSYYEEFAGAREALSVGVAETFYGD